MVIFCPHPLIKSRNFGISNQVLVFYKVSYFDTLKKDIFGGDYSNPIDNGEALGFWTFTLKVGFLNFFRSIFQTLNIFRNHFRVTKLENKIKKKFHG